MVGDIYKIHGCVVEVKDGAMNENVDEIEERGRFWSQMYNGSSLHDRYVLIDAGGVMWRRNEKRSKAKQSKAKQSNLGV